MWNDTPHDASANGSCRSDLGGDDGCWCGGDRWWLRLSDLGGDDGVGIGDVVTAVVSDLVGGAGGGSLEVTMVCCSGGGWLWI